MIIRPGVILDANEQMAKAARLISEGKTTVIVQKNGRYYGIISDKTLKRIQYMPESKVGTYAWKAPLIKTEYGTEKKIELFSEGYRELPIAEGETILGLVRNTDLLQELIENDKIPPLKVEEVMNVPVEKIDINEGISKVAAIMRKERKHHIVVTENKKPVAIVSSIDILPLLQKVKTKAPMGREKMGLKTIMLKTVVGSSPKLLTISKNSSLREAAKLMIKNEVSSLLVVDEDTLGIITVVDILKISLPKHQTIIEIIGLDEKEKEYKPDIYNEIQDFAESFEKIMPIEFIRLKIKKHSATGKRHKYTMKLLVSGKITFEVSSFDWKLFSALKEVLKEAEKKIKNEKDKEKGKKTGYAKLRRLSIQIQEGDLYPGKPEKE